MPPKEAERCKLIYKLGEQKINDVSLAKALQLAALIVSWASNAQPEHGPAVAILNADCCRKIGDRCRAALREGVMAEEKREAGAREFN